MNISIPENKADCLVKRQLIMYGYSEQVEIKRYLLDDNIINYFVYNTIYYHGNETKVLSILSCTDYMNYLKESLEENDNQIYSIYPKVEREKITYNVSFYQKSKRKNYKKR